ncbi:hypothetical protein EON63_11285 [archaeon]|nr:MAG: hypothetical protein EON63_11285 [archaeon]
MRPIPYTIHHIPYTLYYTPYTIHYTPCTSSPCRKLAPTVMATSSAIMKGRYSIYCFYVQIKLCI